MLNRTMQNAARALAVVARSDDAANKENAVISGRQQDTRQQDTPKSRFIIWKVGRDLLP